MTIVLSSVAVVLSLALLVGWTYVLLRNTELTQEFTANISLLISGIVSFAVIMTVLVLFTVFLVREIAEVRRQDSFIDSVTHELKSPLASLRLALETMARHELERDRQAQLHGMMLADVQRLATLVDDILAASRVAAGEAARTLDEIQLLDRVEVAIRRVRQQREVSLEAFSVEVPPEITFVTDKGAVDAILLNLIDNAVKYSGDAVEITIRASQGDKEVHLEVADHGIGIPHKDIRKVFQRFYRVPDEKVREQRGTGLGLYLVAAFVRNIGGKVTAESAGPDLGTVVRLRLPLRARKAGNVKRSL